jgi:hypothetical protein
MSLVQNAVQIAALAALGALMPGGTAMTEEFATRAEAIAYLSTSLHNETAANPNYLTRSDGTLSQWLTDEASFSISAGAVRVTMRESYTQTKDGKTVPGKHEAEFSLAEVVVSDFTAPGDVTPAGSPARGLLFTCMRPGCVAASWSGQPSHADKSDIYIQDDGARARILAAFKRLQSE